MKLRFVLLSLFVFSISHSQISSNSFMIKESQYFDKTKKDSYTFWLNNNFNHLKNDSMNLGIDVNGRYKSGAIDIAEIYNDNLSYQLSPYFHYKTSANLELDIRVNLENIQDDYIYPQRVYWSDDFLKHRANFDIANLTYNTKSFEIKFGRDYYMPGIYLYENLLFSKYNYSYDQIGFEYHNDYISISSYYLALNSTVDTLSNNRHINVHRITVNLGSGYLAFNDLMIYGGNNVNPDIMAFNPLILLYPYRKNKKHLDANNIMSLEFYYNYNDYFIFTEFLLDDWQADNEIPSDLEPTEWGVNTTFGKNNLFRNIDWKINYTRVANRTFNAPTHMYEKFIHKNYPIGHFLGNNFWETKTTLSYNPKSCLKIDVTLSHLEYGDEALYGEFNTAFLKNSVSEGYDEGFPFGNIQKQTGVILHSFYNFKDNILVRIDMSYWINNSRLQDELNISIGIGYRLELLRN